MIDLSLLDAVSRWTCGVRSASIVIAVAETKP